MYRPLGHSRGYSGTLIYTHTQYGNQGCARLSFRSVGGPALKSSRAGGRKQKQENGPRGPGAPHENRHIPSAREVVTVVTVM